jgi:hypothetical protein
MTRKNIPNKMRFEVFKRDKFTCQYCGKKAPDVVLNADHIKPVAEGGKNSLVNLVTSCFGCNNGKAATPLDDSSAVEKARAQADAIAERRQQIEMMARWQMELASLDPETEAISVMLSKVGKRVLTEEGKKAARKLVRKYGLTEVMQCIAISFDQYDVESAWGKVEPILRRRKFDHENPELSAIKRVFNAIVRTMPYDTNKYFQCFGIVKGWHDDGYNATELLRSAQQSGRDYWTHFRDRLTEIDTELRSYHAQRKTVTRIPQPDEDLFA